ncbi:NAD(P)-dependent alcohol dehydrogenase, partial [Acidobacteria bacterium ACD]|nr:NAD(P)-dependent alcohol dehydrogenase [Acidobacteria bacterium ACD]
MIRTLGYAVDDAKSPFHRTEIDRRDPGPRDVQIAVEWCGVCHSDLHTARSEWPGTLYP